MLSQWCDSVRDTPTIVVLLWSHTHAPTLHPRPAFRVSTGPIKTRGVNLDPDPAMDRPLFFLRCSPLFRRACRLPYLRAIKVNTSLLAIHSCWQIIVNTCKLRRCVKTGHSSAMVENSCLSSQTCPYPFGVVPPISFLTRSLAQRLTFLGIFRYLTGSRVGHV